MVSYDFIESAIWCAFNEIAAVIHPNKRQEAQHDAPMSDTSQTIGEAVRQRRKFLQLRQRDLAELAGVTLRGLTELENGRGNPTLGQLAKLAEVLGLRVALIERGVHAPG
jgi:DNA-binding XRE family transcriptional regulator